MINKHNFKVFKGLLTWEALEIVLDRKNYNNSQLCSVCNEFEPRGFFQHFHLYTDEKRECFITLHSKCAFKEGIYEKLNDLLDNIDYITYFD